MIEVGDGVPGDRVSVLDKAGLPDGDKVAVAVWLKDATNAMTRREAFMFGRASERNMSSEVVASVEEVKL